MIYLRGDSQVLDIASLVAEFKSSGGDAAMRHQIASKLILVLEAVSDPKGLFDALLQLPAVLFAALETADVRAVRKFASQFFAHATKRPDNRDYNFADVIGDAAQRLFTQSKDDEVRAALAETNLLVGTEYNRYHVMETLGDMLASVRRPDEVAYLCQRLGRHSLATRKHARTYFRSKIQIPAALAGIFPKS